MITEFDTDGSGSIEFNEFLQMMSKKMVGADGEFELKEAFKWVWRDVLNLSGIRIVIF